jgi:hypothetical protein
VLCGLASLLLVTHFCDVLLVKLSARCFLQKGESVYLLDVDMGEMSQCRMLHGYFDHVHGILSDTNTHGLIPVPQEKRGKLIYEMKYIYIYIQGCMEDKA